MSLHIVNWSISQIVKSLIGQIVQVIELVKIVEIVEAVEIVKSVNWSNR